MDDFVSLVELNSQNPLYEKFQDAYDEIYKNNTGESGRNGSKFLGGNPVTLTNDHVTSLTVKDHYCVSPKIDGERMLLLAIRDFEDLDEYTIDDTKFCFTTR
jgi:hypothetical protein